MSWMQLRAARSRTKRGSARCKSGCRKRRWARSSDRQISHYCGAPAPAVRRVSNSLMNVLILAAGYATRLYPLTLTKAKPLLEVAGKPMIDWVLDNLAPIDELKRVYVVTNNKFVKDFRSWAEAYSQKKPRFDIQIIDDGSTDDSDKLGAIGDIVLAVNRQELANDDLIVVAGDNLFSEPLADFARAAKSSEATLATYDVGDLEAIKKYSSITTDSNGVITRFEEKPPKPENTMAGIALYYFSRETVPLFTTYVA